MKTITLHITLIGELIPQMIGSTITESRKKYFEDECRMINIDFLNQLVGVV